jgi:hypothetical protein
VAGVLVGVGLAVGRAMRQAPPPLIVENSPALTVPPESIPSRPTRRETALRTEGSSIGVGEKPLAAAAEDVTFICGAKTKSGTPCTRKVHGNVRCYQHKGQPAMLPPEQLIVKK